MKGFLSTLKGKIIAGVASVLVVTGVVVTVVAVTYPKDYRTIKIDELNGLTIISNESNSSQEAYEGMNLKSGDIVTVQEDAHMILLLDMDKYIFADAGTKFTVEASGNSENSNTKTRIVLEEGSVLCRIDSKLDDDESFEVETPNSVMSVRGTIFKMTAYKDKDGENYTTLDVLEGSVNVDSYKDDNGRAYAGGIVGMGQTAHINGNISNCYSLGSTNGYSDYSTSMAQYVVSTIDSGREICVTKEVFEHSTGLATHPEEETVIKEPTCSEEGEKEIYCSTCDRVVRVEKIEKSEHTPGEWEEKFEGSCQEKATKVLLCTTCNEVIETKETDYGAHDFGDWVESKAATCTEAGEEIRTCTVCGTSETREIVAKSHSYGEWTVTTAATCEGTGLQTRTCNSCGINETQTVAALGHSYPAHTSEIWHNYNSPTDYTVGASIDVFCYVNCTRCNVEYTYWSKGTILDTNGTYVYEWKCSCGYTE